MPFRNADWDPRRTTGILCYDCVACFCWSRSLLGNSVLEGVGRWGQKHCPFMSESGTAALVVSTYGKGGKGLPPPPPRSPRRNPELRKTEVQWVLALILRSVFSHQFHRHSFPLCFEVMCF